MLKDSFEFLLITPQCMFSCFYEEIVNFLIGDRHQNCLVKLWSIYNTIVITWNACERCRIWSLNPDPLNQHLHYNTPKEVTHVKV